MNHHTHSDIAKEPAGLAYDLSSELINSGVLSTIQDLSRKDKECLIRYINSTVDKGLDAFEDLSTDLPYSIEELHARIDEAEAEMDCGEGKTFEEMMNGFKKELLWLK